MQNHLLLTSTVLFGATLGVAHAQVPANPSQGQYVAPYGAGPAANNNNNSWGIANTPSGSAAAGSLSSIYAPNTVGVPAPGTVVIRLNGRVEVDVTATYTSLDRGVSSTGATTGYKVNPIGVSSSMRLYPGFDGLAANGLRYGASVEVRENFSSGVFSGSQTTLVSGTSTATSPSANSSAETVYVRRAFSYLATDQAGILRFGQSDGVLGLFDNCVFTSQCWDAGIQPLNGTSGPTIEAPGGGINIPFAWLNQTAADYGNNKIVYLSPQFYGFDFGVQYAPGMGNALQSSGAGVGCTQASANCIGLTSGNDSTRWYNQVGVGLRYQQSFGALEVKAYGFYETAGKENNTINPTIAVPGTVAFRTAGTGTLRYDNLSFYKAGLALTAANLTLAADYIGGAVNGALSMRPAGGAPMNAVMTGVTYANGPITLGAQIGLIDSQGDARLTSMSQRHEYEVAFGGTYKAAPGIQLVGEYLYTHRHQGGFDFAANALGQPGGATTAGTTTRDAQGQGFLLATVLTW